LWVGTLSAGLNRFDRGKKIFTNYRHDPNDPHSLSSNAISAILQDRSGVLWIGTTNAGLNKLVQQKSDEGQNKISFVRDRHDPADANSLSDDLVTAIYEDRSGALWVGTRSGGLNQLVRAQNSSAQHGNAAIASNGSNQEQIAFLHYRHDPAIAHSLSSDQVSSICEDRSGNLWIGTYDGGLNKVDVKRKAFNHYFSDPTTSQNAAYNVVLSFFEDKSGVLWVGSGGGLDRFDRRTNSHRRFHHEPANPNSLSHPYVSSLYLDAANCLWIGTYGGGLNKLDLAGSGRPMISRPSFAPDQAVVAGEMNVSHERFIHFTEEDGLASNSVYGILGDERGNLWLSTNRGLSKFDPANEAIRNYDVTDGLQSYEFNAGAGFKNREGEMFFGGINGFNSFYPDSIKDRRYIPPVVLTAFKKFDKLAPLEKELSEIEHLAMSHKENFSFEFVALDYATPQVNQYAYQLEGFDADWIYCGSRRFASYTNLNPGEYVFRAKGSNSDGVWNETGVAIKITIHPPFWRTWWFALSSSISLIAGIVFFHRYSVKRRIRHVLEIESARLAENERVRKQVANDFHDELGQKLTHISLYSELLKRALDDSSEKWPDYLNKINSAALYLSESIRNFIWALDPQQDSLFHLAVYLKNLGDELFHETGVHFSASPPSEAMKNIKLSMPWRRHLTFIIKEGMSNILKHAACRHVELAVALEGSELSMTLADDGKGFDSANGRMGEGIRKMKWSAKNIQGELEIISTVGKGAMVRFKGQCPNADEPRQKEKFPTDRRTQLLKHFSVGFFYQLEKIFSFFS
jgi:signal transduction histidine kinase